MSAQRRDIASTLRRRCTRNAMRPLEVLWSNSDASPPFPVFRCPEGIPKPPILSIPWYCLPIASSAGIEEDAVLDSVVTHFNMAVNDKEPALLGKQHRQRKPCVTPETLIFVTKHETWRKREVSLTLVLLNPDIPSLSKQCRSRSVGFWRSQLIWICTVYQQECELITTI